MSLPCQLILHGALSGADNMAIDASLLDRAVDGICSLRFYRWFRPTISLGHFQNLEDGVEDRFAGLDVVKRLSGGGAILHDRELTYSISLPTSHPATAAPGSIYEIAHDVIIEVLKRYDVVSQMRGDANADPANKSFLCFSRGDARDVVIGSNKIVGSAQRRRQGAILQHGSILLQQSTYAPEFPGIEELTSQRLPIDQLQNEIATGMLEAFDLQLDYSET